MAKNADKALFREQFSVLVKDATGNEKWTRATLTIDTDALVNKLMRKVRRSKRLTTTLGNGTIVLKANLP